LHDLKETVNEENLISIFSRSISVRSPLKLLFLVVTKNVAVEKGDASTGIVEVATASAGVERIQGRKTYKKKLEHKQLLCSLRIQPPLIRAKRSNGANERRLYSQAK